MKIIVGLCTVFLLFGCKPAERGSESPKARFEPKTTTAAEKAPAAAERSPASQRREESVALERDLSKLEHDTAALEARHKALISPPNPTVREELTALSAKVAVLRSEITSAQQLDDAAWPARREKLTSDLATYRRELQGLSDTSGS
ncbi:MAG: hypothetical protein RL417_1629 [Pseudomonadota bacterium]|jgi:hypothetical protein